MSKTSRMMVDSAACVHIRSRVAGRSSWWLIVIAGLSVAFVAGEVWLLANLGIVEPILLPIMAFLLGTGIFWAIAICFGDDIPDRLCVPLYVFVVVILYGLSFFLNWQKVAERREVFGSLAKEFSSSDSATQRSIVAKFFDLDRGSRKSALKVLQKDAKLLGSIESSLYRLAKEGGGEPGLLLAELDPRYDREFLSSVVQWSALLLDKNGEWKNIEVAKRQYNIIRGFGQRLIPVLTAEVIHPFFQAINPDYRLQILFLTLKLGIDGSEESLCGALEEHGDIQMAEDFLNSGSERLATGARRWAESRGYTIVAGQGSHRVSWRNF